MHVSNLTYPDGITEPTEAAVGRYENLVWYNSEVCNNCFQQVRAIGEVVEKRTELHVHKLRKYYERTEYGSQEHDPFALPSDCYGQCYCLDCGADTKAGDETLSLAALKPRLKNLLRYVNAKTRYRADPHVTARTVRRLKDVCANAGYDSEILCVATVEGIKAGSGWRHADRDTAPRATAD